LLDESGKVLGTYDAVVDASGLNSKLRKVRVCGETSIKEHYTGITMIQGIIEDPDSKIDQEILRKLGQGTAGIIGNGS
jgi:hypothetical protein